MQLLRKIESERGEEVYNFLQENKEQLRYLTAKSKEIITLKEAFKEDNEFWFNIANANILPRESISSQKGCVFAYIKQQNNQELVKKALTKDTPLHHFFATKRGVFPTSKHAGSFARFKDEFAKNTADEKTIPPAPPSIKGSA